MTEKTYADVSALFPGKEKRKRRYQDVTLPIAGVTVRIRSLFAGEVTKFQSSLVNQKNRRFIQSRFEESTARLIVLCVVDENGTRIMSNEHVKQITEEWDNADVACLSSACTKHCGMDEDEFEDLAKNSGTIQFDSANSGSAEAAAV